MLHLSPTCRYYFYNSPTDMRKGIDSLSGLVAEHMQLNALSGSVFIFFNRKSNQVKLLSWEGDGFGLYYKRLEKGTYERPSLSGDNCNITAQQLQLILQGIQLKSIKMKPRFLIPAGINT